MLSSTVRVAKLHGPLLRVSASAILSFTVLASLQVGDTRVASPWAISIALASGGIYTQIFEYLLHRLAMHGVGGPLWRSHLEHHRIFHGDNFATRSEMDLGHVAGRWYLFPPCFALHYALASLFAGPELATGFALGCLLHYLAFEITHWFAHVEDNLFDRVVARIPGLGALRERQLLHHREHHERPDVNFGFTPPYLGDVLTGTPTGAQGSGGVLSGGRRWRVARSKA